jgi:hypothetical protein
LQVHPEDIRQKQLVGFAAEASRVPFGTLSGGHLANRLAGDARKNRAIYRQRGIVVQIAS